MTIKSVFDQEFVRYGKVITGYNVQPLLAKLMEVSPRPKEGTVYKPGDTQLENVPVAAEIAKNFFGGQEVQIGYCNGYNVMLNCLEYHRNSEINITADDIILLVAPLQEVHEGTLDTSKVEAFLAPAGTMVQFYETTLHYAPCCAVKDGNASDGFSVIVMLPAKTNTAKPEIEIHTAEDKLLWANNKWLIAHPDTAEAKAGAFVGLTGKNISVLDK
ncbi:MAG: DUF4867 domain-containing protein [Treponema sp. CETP13]|nr:MAG: DUF4867 domain-containing protein [Treponema sp. CETP13]